MTYKKSNDSRRKLLKSIAAGSGAVVAGKTLPESWSKPVIDTVLLPAHAVTSGYSITVAVKNDRETDECGEDGETVNITGTVVASNGSDLAGVKLNIHYTDNPPAEAFKDIVVTVQSGNTYSYSGLVVASVGGWDAPPYKVVVTFVDQSKYGTATASADGKCGNLPSMEEEIPDAVVKLKSSAY